jgi:RND family efflux transporter MFP subunit
MAVLEIPELELQLQADDAAIKAADDQVKRLGRQVDAVEARTKVLQSAYDRLAGVAKSAPPGTVLVAQQEIDDAQGRALTAQADVEAAKANLEAAQSQAEAARAKRMRDGALFEYAKIPAPFDGVVTQRYANYGTLMQGGTNSSTQAMALVRLSEDDKFRLVIPVPETYVRYIHLNDPVSVNVPSLNRTFPGKVARFSVDVKEETRTMHTEVDVLNVDRTLVPGLYADATIQLQRKQGALAVPSQALNREGDRVTVDVVGRSNKIEVRPVVTGIETAEDVEILSGVNEGELVVTGDRSGLKAGQSVMPKIVTVMEYQDKQ